MRVPAAVRRLRRDHAPAGSASPHGGMAVVGGHRGLDGGRLWFRLLGQPHHPARGAGGGSAAPPGRADAQPARRQPGNCPRATDDHSFLPHAWLPLREPVTVAPRLQRPVLAVVERIAGSDGRVELDVPLGDRPGAGDPVDSDGRPSAAVLVADVDKERVVVVFDPDPVPGVALLAQGAGLTARRRGRYEGAPAAAAGRRTCNSAAQSAWHEPIVTERAAGSPVPGRCGGTIGTKLASGLGRTKRRPATQSSTRTTPTA